MCKPSHMLPRSNFLVILEMVSVMGIVITIMKHMSLIMETTSNAISFLVSSIVGCDDREEEDTSVLVCAFEVAVRHSLDKNVNIFITMMTEAVMDTW